MPNRVNSAWAELGNIRNKTPENLIIKKVCDLLSRIDTRSLRSFHLDKRKESRSFSFVIDQRVGNFTALSLRSKSS